jgi:hypothetical protein
MFWVMNGLLFIAAMLTMKHDPNGSARGVQLLSRPQTEEWKGWMQFAFIMVRYSLYVRPLVLLRCIVSYTEFAFAFVSSITTIGLTVCTTLFVSLFRPMFG